MISAGFMSTENFNPNSVDAKLATILERLDSMEQRDGEFRTQLMARLSNAEVAIQTLMQWRYYIIGAAAAIAIVAKSVWGFITGKA
jgi:hypothetical protein